MSPTSGADDGSATWKLFLSDALERVTSAAHALAPPSGEPRLAVAAGELFALRTGAQLLGVDDVADLAEAIERALDGAVDERAWTANAAAVTSALTVLRAALDELGRPDASGARVSTAPLAEAIHSLGGAAVPAAGAKPASSVSDPSSDETPWVPQVDEDMVDPFIEEATDRLEALAQKLLRLEQSPGDTELVREIFRDLHTVKGSSGFVGLRKMNRLAHAAEDLVGQVRDGTRLVDRPLVDALLGALDGLRAVLDRAVARAPIDVELEPLMARLRLPTQSSALADPPLDEAPPPRAGNAATPPHSLDTHAAEAAGHGGPAKQTLRVDFDKLDLLLNLVGELVLNKANLRSGVGGLGALGRELDAQLRRARRLRRGVGAGPSTVFVDDLDRAARVFDELSHDLDTTAGRIDHVAAELREQVMKLRMLPIARVFNKYHRTVRELAHSLGKRVRLEVEGAETELDKVLVEQLDDPLLHLVRNAIDHGCETPERRLAAGKPAEATVTLGARHQGSQILIEVADDGAGIEPARLRKKALEKGLATAEEVAAMDDRSVLDIIFRPGFSTAARVSEVSGRGVGMDVVREAITRLKGSIEIDSHPGEGTRFTLKLPLTLAIIQVLLIRVAGQDLAIPLDTVKRTLHCRGSELAHVHQRPMILLENQEIPLIPLTMALDLEATAGDDEEFPVILVEVLGELFALGCDRLVGKQEIVIKTLGELLEEVPCAAGATLVGDRVALILDVPQVVQRGVRKWAERTDGARTQRSEPLLPPARIAATGAGSRRPRILVAEDSDLIRESLKRLFEGHGYDVVAARDGAEALSFAERDPAGFDAVSTDVMMPNMDGYELTRRLRQTERHRHVPIVMVTARGEKIDRVRGFDAGVDEYIVKPLDHGEILRAVARHLAQPAKRPADSRPPTPGTGEV